MSLAVEFITLIFIPATVLVVAAMESKRNEHFRKELIGEVMHYMKAYHEHAEALMKLQQELMEKEGK